MSTSKKFDLFKQSLDKITQGKNKVSEHIKTALNTPTITEFRKFYGQHETQVQRTVGFSKEMLRTANTLLNAEKTNIISYMTLASSTKETYNRFFTTSFNSRFAPSWTQVSGYQIYSKSLADTIEEKYGENIVKEDAKRCLVLPEFSLYWGHIGDSFYANTPSLDVAKEFIEKIFWEQYESAVVIAMSNGNLVFEKMPNQGFVASKKAQETSEYLNKFLSKGISRSVLFYGPPGTGKSNIVKNVANALGRRTMNLNFADLSNCSTSFMHEFLSTFKPDVVILEDIDHTKIENSSNLLAIIETINKGGKLLLATTNAVNTLNDAVIRPGRFDELIEIDKFDDQVLLQIIGGDKELFEIVKDFPIASTMELMKRIEALGRDDALKTVGDIKQRCKNMKERYNCKLTEDKDAQVSPTVDVTVQ